MTIEPTIVFTRLTFISNDLRKLRRFENISLEEYLNDEDQQLISERLLERIIQAALDINEHLLVQGLGIQLPKQYKNRESFLQAGYNGIITSELATELAESAGLRNLLAHQYIEIDYRLMFNHIEKALNKYPSYVQQVTAYINSLRK